MSTKTTSKVITCKAVVCWGAEGPVKLEEIQVDPPKSSEVRLQMLYASVCHTDILCIKGIPAPLYPRVIGHEGVGVVESVGEEVSDLKEGDLVMPTFIGECKTCENCKSGNNICQTHPISYKGLMLDGSSRFSIGGQKLYQLFSCSTWSQYTVINSNYVLKIDGNLGLPHASVISCGFSTGFGAAWKEAQIEKGSTVAVFGLGAVGLGAVEGARMQGATKIIGVDKNERKREKGEAFGITDFINPTDSNKSVSELVKEMTGGVGVDYCIECTGATPLINEGLESTKVGKGKMVMVGLGNVATAPLSFMSLLIGRTLKGSIFGGIKVKSDLPVIIHKCINKEIQLDELMTHEVALEDIDQAFELLNRQDCVKVLIKI